MNWSTTKVYVGVVGAALLDCLDSTREVAS